jgi:hypothetical protein
MIREILLVDLVGIEPTTYPCLAYPRRNLPGTVPTMADSRIVGNRKLGKTAFPNASEVKALSPHHRFLIALHSSDGVAETGLRVCPPEKNARKLARGVRRHTFSGAV